MRKDRTYRVILSVSGTSTLPAVVALLEKDVVLHASILEHYAICFKTFVRTALFLSFLHVHTQ